MQLPVPLLRQDKRANKNRFGHVLVLAGSPAMLGASALTGLSAMRSGAGLTTIGVAKSLNLTLQKKVSSVIMTLPLPETRVRGISSSAFFLLKKIWSKYSAVAIGPGLTTGISTKKFVLYMVEKCPLPMVVDADALSALVGHLAVLKGFASIRILTPHPGEFARLTGHPTPQSDSGRRKAAKEFAVINRCVLVLKGHHSVVVSAKGQVYVNKTGNSGMATAGSGDVLSGMIAAFLAQGIHPFEAAKLAVHLHGQAGDIAARRQGQAGMIATDLIDAITAVMKGSC